MLRAIGLLKLAAAGVKDAFVVKNGAWQNAISLGLYANDEAAGRRVREALAQGARSDGGHRQHVARSLLARRRQRQHRPVVEHPDLGSRRIGEADALEAHRTRASTETEAMREFTGDLRGSAYPALAGTG